MKQGHVPPEIIYVEVTGDDAMAAGELTKEMSMEKRMQKAEDQGKGGGGWGKLIVQRRMRTFAPVRD